MAYKFSINAKLNAVLNEILDDLACIHDTEAESLDEIKHYMESFPHEVDYNLVQYGNMIIYYDSMRDMYRRAGYKSMDRMSDNAIWELYKKQTGYVARIAMRENLIAA